MSLAIPAATVRGLASLRAQAATFERFRGFDRCVRKLRASASAAGGGGGGGEIPIGAVAELYAHWGDPPTQADESFLRSCLAEVAQAPGAIVQCGASLLTLVLGSVCQGEAAAARQLWCLEHDAHWASVVRSWLTQYRIGNTHVITTRAQLADGYVWYGVDPERLAGNVSLLLCDGARATPQGVIGALERIGSRLAPSSTVLARHVSRADDVRAVQAWAKAHDAACVVVDRQQGFIKLSRRAAG
ncbi:MAG: hypothetical protein RIB46_05785 [Pseudomonadales bacterium]